MNNKKESVTDIIMFTAAILLVLAIGYVNGRVDGIIHSITSCKVISCSDYGLLKLSIAGREIIRFVH